MRKKSGETKFPLVSSWQSRWKKPRAQILSASSLVLVDVSVETIQEVKLIQIVFFPDQGVFSEKNTDNKTEQDSN